ncbi:MAG: peptidoglycan editing factor PgeF [Methylococcales bacterium]|nr:peptidoglycan editing factor PgeF [Methylococcales bacterium]MBT7411013.1 peptidoglycan editing factor PgeF [Methylococcales bacterium]
MTKIMPPYDWLSPDWPAPENIRAICTTRSGGCSLFPYHSMNLGDHVDDDLQHVNANRQHLKRILALPRDPRWLTQIHGNEIIDADKDTKSMAADGIITSRNNMVCTVLTADCVPVLLCDQNGHQVCAVHAGWKGLAGCIIAQAIAKFDCKSSKLMAWIGPAISQVNYQVNQAMVSSFVEQSISYQQAFKYVDNDQYLADLVLLAKLQMQALGLNQIYGGQWCTFADDSKFFSYRRQNITGRMATLIWKSDGN